MPWGKQSRNGVKINRNKYEVLNRAVTESTKKVIFEKTQKRDEETMLIS